MIIRTGAVVVAFAALGAVPSAASMAATAAGGAGTQVILDRARLAMGLSSEEAEVTFLAAQAECRGPRGDFLTRVVSARDGRMRFEQIASERHVIRGIDDGRAWQLDPATGRREPADEVTLTFLKGHELHMLALAPTTRLSSPRAAGVREFADQSVYVVAFRDDLGAAVEIYYSVATGLPAGMKNVNHTGRGERDIYVRFSDWQPVDDLKLFRTAVFSQGADDYVYHYGLIDPHAAVDALSETWQDGRDAVGLAIPAAEFCSERGHSDLETGQCTLADGTVVDTRAYFRREQKR